MNTAKRRGALDNYYEKWNNLVTFHGGGGGGVLRGKKDRDDRRKSYKTTLKNTKP